MGFPAQRNLFSDSEAQKIAAEKRETEQLSNLRQALEKHQVKMPPPVNEQSDTPEFEAKKPTARKTPIKKKALKAKAEKPAYRKSGRPRCDMTREAILEATNKLLLHMSFSELSIEAIARKAGVGKTTIYRWWPNKLAVVVEAATSMLPEQIESAAALPLTTRIEKQLGYFSRCLKGRTGRVITEMFAGAQGDRDQLTIFYSGFMLAHEKALADLIEEGKQSGEIAQTLDLGHTVDYIYGSIFYHLMSSETQLEQDFVDKWCFNASRLIFKA